VWVWWGKGGYALAGGSRVAEAGSVRTLRSTLVVLYGGGPEKRMSATVLIADTTDLTSSADFVLRIKLRPRSTIVTLLPSTLKSCWYQGN